MEKPIQLLVSFIDNIYRVYGGEMSPTAEKKVQEVLRILNN